MEPEEEKRTVAADGDAAPGTDGEKGRPGNGGRWRSYPRRAAHSRIALVLFAVALVVAFAVYWFLYRPWVSTDDAQVDGHISTVSARVGGYVTRVAVEDNDRVRAGQLLVSIDPADYRIALERAQADYEDALASAEAVRAGVPITSVTTSSELATAEAKEANARAGVIAAERGLEVAQALEREAEARDVKAQTDLARYRVLYAREALPKQTYDKGVAEAKASAAVLDAARASAHAAAEHVAQARGFLAQAEAEVRTAGTGPRQVSVVKARADSASAATKKYRTALEQAELNLGYTDVLAPVSGIVGNRTVEVGQNVAAGQTLLFIVQVNDLWVTANFKETEIRDMKTGQPATIHVDANGRTYKGHVDSIAGASGSRFSLFPPENATGNYVKVVQRIPVKIVFEKGQGVDRDLRPGMSVEPDVKVK